MKHLLTMGLVLTCMFGCSAWIAPVCADGNVNVLYGAKGLNEDDWEPVEDQVAYGMMADFKLANWPVAIATDLLFSSDNTSYAGTTVEGRTSEFDLGIRWYSNAVNNVRLYAGGGLARIAGEFEAYNMTDSDEAFGFWIDTGIVLTLKTIFNLGVDLRYSKAQIDLFDVDTEAGGLLVGVFAGLNF